MKYICFMEMRGQGNAGTADGAFNIVTGAGRKLAEKWDSKES
jgi:hypothetical protein